MVAHTDPYRLPRTVIPSHYDLTLEPNLDQATFTGAVTILVEATAMVETIWLNAAELQVTSAQLEDTSGHSIAIADVTLVETQERLRLGLAPAIPEGSYRLRLTFHGVLNDKLHGFYRSVFHDEHGHEHVIATTQFETTDARRAFPCFDEPDFKATFGVTLVVPEGLFAVSNGPIVDTTPTGDGRCKVVFANTMVMSTYLVAFCVGPFEATSAVDVNGVPLRIVHPIGKGHLTEYALAVGAFALRYFTEYYGIPYPDQKLDMVAIPDFAFGAMENLGCITYREILLLIDQRTATQPELMRVADVIAHEIAHMWFGDLVTMRWWNGIWLNEAFATFMATMAVDAFNKEWQRWVQFSLERSAAFEVDSLVKTRSIEYPVQSPQDANGMFDLLTYEKGGAVLRMLEQYLGEDRFRDGVRHYLTQHQFANTETNDLWDAIEEVTQEPTRRVMDSWIFQRGFPLLSVEGGADGKLTLRQERFSFSPLDDDHTVWSVPVVLRYGRGDQIVEHRELLEASAVALDLGGPSDWLVVNAGGHGFYRVRYMPAQLRQLTAVMKHQLAAIERYGLVDDTWAAVVAGIESSVQFIDLAQACIDETDLDVWAVLSSCLAHLERLLTGQACHRYHTLLRSLFSPTMTRLGWQQRPEDTSRTLELRALLLRALTVTARDDTTLAISRDLHTHYLRDSNSVEPNMASAAAAAVAANGNGDDYAAFVKRSKQAATPQEERRYQTLLAAFPGTTELATTLTMTLNGEVRTQDAPYLVAHCLRHRDHGAQAWAFVKANWDEMARVYPDNAIVRMLDGIKALNQPEVAADVAAFFESHTVPVGQLTLQQHLEKLRLNVALRQRETERLTASLLA